MRKTHSSCGLHHMLRTGISHAFACMCETFNVDAAHSPPHRLHVPSARSTVTMPHLCCRVEYQYISTPSYRRSLQPRSKRLLRIGSLLLKRQSQQSGRMIRGWWMSDEAEADSGLGLTQHCTEGAEGCPLCVVRPLRVGGAIVDERTAAATTVSSRDKSWAGEVALRVISVCAITSPGREFAMCHIVPGRSCHQLTQRQE